MAVNRPQVIASAEKLVSRGKIEAAIKEYRKLLADNPNDASTLNRLGDLFARVDRIDEAVRLFSQIADRYTDDGFFVKAIAIFKKIIKLDPTRLAVYERLAELYHKQGLIPEARTQYQVLVDYYQKHANAASAIGILQKMAVLVPDDPGPHVKLAEHYHAQKLTDKALAEYRVIADLMLRHNKVDEATQVYGKAIEAEPGDIAFITDAVLGLKDAGHVGAAARLLALAVEKNPQAEKIARLAGLGRESTQASSTATQPLKVSDITHPGRSEREVLQLDPSVLEGGAPRREKAAATTPASFFPPPRPAPPVAPSLEDGEVDLVLDLPGDGESTAPSTLVSPTDEMLRRSPDSPWFDGAAGLEGEVEVEFELELDLGEVGPGEALEGLQDLSPVETEEPVALEAPAVEFELPSSATGSLPAFEAEVEEASSAARAFDSSFSQEGSSEEYEIDWRFEPEPELELPAIGQLQADGGAPASGEAPRGALNYEELERTSYEVAPEPASGARRQGDLLAEAEVFHKYGLREKAQDRVRELLQMNPRHVGANGLLVTLWIEEGKHDRAMTRANQLAKLAEESRDESVWTQVRNRLVRAGFDVRGNQVVGLPAAPKKKDRIASLLEDLAGYKATPTTPRAATPPVEIPIELPEEPPLEEPPAPRAFAPSRSTEALDDELPEIVLPILTPGEVATRKPKAPAGGAPGKATKPPATPKAPVTPAQLEADESLSWLDQAVAAPATRKSEEEKLFDEEEGFFDLAAELEQELSDEELMSGRDLMPTPTEQSLEEIVEGFKKGVAESLSAEDYDTHYNLGIAYREMGLLDEAIGEFQLASKEPRYLVDCCSLLGGCFLEKGLPELATKWYKRGLETPNLPEEAYLGLLYDLGNVYQFQGDADRARTTFVEIYGVNSNYRDVVAKLSELGHPH
ncbi:MAG: tetratricopeptide repeat protein [Thermoanaerobaculia bacterium]